MLRNNLIRFISHKLHLSNCSLYYQNHALRYSIDWANNFINLLKFRGNQLSEKEVALMTINAQKHLKNLIPHENNKSHASSQKSFNQIMSDCANLLKPKVCA
jgi:hypothetical protein